MKLERVLASTNSILLHMARNKFYYLLTYLLARHECGGSRKQMKRDYFEEHCA